MSTRKIAVIGAGIMGHGIAQQCAMSEFATVLVDINEGALQHARERITASLNALESKKRLEMGQRDATQARIATSTSFDAIADADVVIEAATESLPVKADILRRIEVAVRQEAVTATNTSSLSITLLASSLKSSHRFIGLHFFNPVPMMQLVEVIRALQTDDRTLNEVTQLCQTLGKQPVNVRNSPGFLVNRLLCPMINEAVFALETSVASAEDIDTAMKLGCNHPIGPLALAAMIGLDTLLSIMQVLHADFGEPKYRPARTLYELVAAGWLGRKSGRGFFRYDERL
jgi:3-hydroxybutyryl-CoA dehydrogenase